MRVEDRDSVDGRELPAHVEDSVRLVAELHVQHDSSASPYERMTSRLVDQLGRFRSLLVALCFIATWVVVNAIAAAAGHAAFDPPPYNYLQGLLSAAALLMTVLILNAQRRETRLAEDRAQLTLQLAVVSEQKIAKLIAILEEQRRDSAHLQDRIDLEARAMAEPSDPSTMLEAIGELRAELLPEA